MSSSIVFNGSTYSLPSSGDTDWAATFNALITALAAASATRATAGAAVLSFGSGSTPVNTATNFLRPGFVTAAADTTEIKLRAPFAGRVSALQVQAGVAAAGGVTTVTVRKAGTNQNLTCTFAAGATQGADNTNELTVAAGDQLSVSIVHGAGIGTGLTNVVATMKLTLA